VRRWGTLLKRTLGRLLVLTTRYERVPLVAFPSIDHR